ncbi:MAG TPA: SIS domain-containing protein [Candidatus Eisenbacteria bacterium]|nr:SIS domain-containing protein [Candidatus Eisenbacteria bacterium]
MKTDTLTRIRADAQRYLSEAVDVLRATADTEAERVARVAALLAERLRRGGTLFTCGNGGSAADAQHVATELAGKFFLHRPGLAAIALTTNTSALTAIANDFSYDEVFVRQLSGLARAGDVLMAFTTSGRSANTRLATEWARAHEVITVGFTGRPGQVWAETLDHAFVVASDVTPHIQQAHITLGHAICALAEAELFGPHGTPPSGSGRSVA